MRITQSEVSTSLGVSFTEKRNRAGFQNIVFKNLETDEFPKKKFVSGNFPHALFSHLNFLTLEAGISKLS